MQTEKQKVDMFLLLMIVILLMIGIVMVYSSSHIWADYKYNDTFFFVKRQILFASVGIVAMVLIMRIPYWHWKRCAKAILIICFILLIIVKIPGIGIVRGGAQSWIGIGAFSIQPSEFMKLGLIIFLAAYLSVHQRKLKSLTKGFLPFIVLVFVAFGLIMLQPDLGTGVVLVLTCIIMIFAAGANISHFIYLSFIGLAGFVFLIASRSEEHTSELQSRGHLVCRLLLEKKQLDTCSNI